MSFYVKKIECSDFSKYTNIWEWISDLYFLPVTILTQVTLDGSIL